MNLNCITIKTRPLLPPQDDIFPILDQYLPALQEKDVLIITSKVLAIHQGRCIKITDKVNKDDLIKQEADQFIPRERVPNQSVVLSIKGNTLIPSSGIDESNADGHYILWPENPTFLAKQICQYLKQKHGLTDLAVIVTDSHTTPLRWGVLGISIGFFGLEPLRDYRGTPDIFGRKLKMTQQNVVDMLAVLGVAAMGEGNEQTPMAIIRGVDFVRFTDKDTYDKFIIPKDQDIYKPLLEEFHSWRQVRKVTRFLCASATRVWPDGRPTGFGYTSARPNVVGT
ncbi:coenzyme F420-0:L-glutamate ligase [Candidatus Uhrbacteria bacterium]|nr:coenzyme F420-0:L-glutamate ligase [Candidatus Uhrbacteria bacterium]